MKITKRQLRRLIREETRINEIVPHLAAAGAIARYAIGDETLSGDAADLWKKLDPRLQKALKGMGAAAQALPGRLKEKAIESMVDLIESATEMLKIDEMINRIINESQ